MSLLAQFAQRAVVSYQARMCSGSRLPGDGQVQCERCKLVEQFFFLTGTAAWWQQGASWRRYALIVLINHSSFQGVQIQPQISGQESSRA
jgi:hypothetical protein